MMPQSSPIKSELFPTLVWKLDLPKLRKIHSFTKILRKVTKKLAYMQIFY